MNVYTEGSAVRLTATFTDPTNGNAAIDPTGIVLTLGQGGLLAPAPTAYTYGVGTVVVRDSVGNYHADIDTTGFAAGTWWANWTGTGAVQAAAQESFGVAEALP